MFKKIVLYLLVIVFILACTKSSKYNENRNIVKENMAKQIAMPKIENKNYLNKCKIKFVTRINANCYPCLYNYSMMELFIEEVLEKYNISVIIYVANIDSTSFYKIYKNKIQFNFPVIFDEKDDFVKKNDLPYDSKFHTMLLDENNKIIILGNPVNNKELKELYIKQINNHINNN